VAKGFHQQLGIDFAETYSPMVKPITSGCQQRLSTWTSSRSSLPPGFFIIQITPQQFASFTKLFMV
jgi:hypothetical protein